MRNANALLVAVAAGRIDDHGAVPDKFVAELKARGIAWFACATALAEAPRRRGRRSGPVGRAGVRGRRPPAAPSMRRTAERSDRRPVRLLPRPIADKLSVPIIATGASRRPRRRAALILGASAVQAAPASCAHPSRAQGSPGWAEPWRVGGPRRLMQAGAFSAGRAIDCDRLRRRAAAAAEAPRPAPTRTAPALNHSRMREGRGPVGRCAADAGLGRPGGGIGAARTAGEIVRRLWDEAQALLQR